MPKGKRPEYDLVVAVEYDTAEGKKTHWHNIGVGWQSDNGTITLNMVTMPGVKLVLIKKEKPEGGR